MYYDEYIDPAYVFSSYRFTDCEQNVVYNQPIDNNAYVLSRDLNLRQIIRFDFGACNVPDENKKDVESKLDKFENYCFIKDYVAVKGDLIIGKLRDHGKSRCFIVDRKNGIKYESDELYKHQNEIRHVLTSHEQGASHAADGYARSTGKVGVCFATSGPGATNLVTGIATAYMDSVPVVAITCNVNVPLLGKDSFQEIVTDRYLGLLKEAFKTVLGFDVDITLVVPSTPPHEVVLAQQYEANPASPQGNYEFTFENFIKGPSNQFAFAAAQAVAANPSGAYNPLFIYGGSGLGKTHLLTAIQTEIKRTHPDFVIMYVTCEQFTNELIAAIRAGSTEDFRMKYRVADLLLVDDIQFIAGKESTQEEFFHTFNSLHDAHKQIVIASDRPAKEIKSLEERLRTRFEWGLTADVQPPDFETRVAIVKRKAELLHLDLPEDVAEFIANHLKNNIRQLEGAVKKLNAYYMLEGIQPVISVAQNAIKDILNETQPVPVTIEKIVGEVSRTFNVSPADIRGTKRNANVASARRVAIYILREVTGMSMEEIGREFSGRDHSTIVYSLKTMERDMKNDQHLRETVSDIIKNVKA